METSLNQITLWNPSYHFSFLKNVKEVNANEIIIIVDGFSKMTVKIFLKGLFCGSTIAAVLFLLYNNTEVP